MRVTIVIFAVIASATMADFHHEGNRASLVKGEKASGEVCTLEYLETPGGKIPYLFNSKTEQRFYIPKIKIDRLELGTVMRSGPLRSDTVAYDLSFRPVMTEESSLEVQALTSAFGPVINLFGEEKYDLTLNGKRVSRSQGVVRFENIGENGFLLMKDVGAKRLDINSYVRLRYNHPCGEELPITGELPSVKDMNLKLTLIDESVSWYPLDVTRRLDRTAEQWGHISDERDRWVTAYDTLRLMLENAPTQDKELIEKLDLDPISLAQEMATRVARETGNWPLNLPLSKEIYSLVQEKWVAVEIGKSGRFQYYFIKNPEKKALFEELYRTPERQLTFGQQLVSQREALGFTQDQYLELFDRAIEPFPKAGRQVISAVTTTFAADFELNLSHPKKETVYQEIP